MAYGVVMRWRWGGKVGIEIGIGIGIGDWGLGLGLGLGLGEVRCVFWFGVWVVGWRVMELRVPVLVDVRNGKL